MKPARLFIAVSVFALAAGLLWWLGRRDSAAPKPSSVEPARLVELKQDQARELVLEKAGAEKIEMRSQGGKWSLTAPKPLGADQEAVAGVLSTLTSLSSDRVVEEKGARLETYGLALPSLTVSATGQDGKTVKLFFGDETPSGTGSYAAVAGDPRVLIVAKYNRTALEKSVDDLRDKRLLLFESDKLTRVELNAKKQSIEFGRTRDQWQIVKPRPFRADQSMVDDLVRSLHEAKMDLSAPPDEKSSAAAFVSGTPVASARVTDVSGTQEMQIRKSQESYYAKSSAVPGFYKISSATATALDKSIEEFRNKKLFEFGYVDPDKIELRDGVKQTQLDHTKGDWWSGGTKMDPETVNSLLGRIRELSASRFLDSGFTMPLMEITVMAGEGKRTEKVLLSRDGVRTLAKREGESAIYEIDSTAINDLRNAADGLKPAPAPAPAKK